MWLLLHPEFISTIHRSRLRNNHRYVARKITSFSPFSSFPQTKMSIQLKLAFFTLKFQNGLNKSADTEENRLLLPLLLSSLSLCSPLRPAGISADTIPSLQDGTDTHISLPGQNACFCKFPLSNAAFWHPFSLQNVSFRGLFLVGTLGNISQIINLSSVII